MKKAFQIEAYLKDSVYHEYMPVNWGNAFPQIEKDQMMLIGRAMTDFVSGDQLLTNSGDSVTALSFWIYGREADFTFSSCACAMICTPIPDIQDVRMLYLPPKHKNKP